MKTRKRSVMVSVSLMSTSTQMEERPFWLDFTCFRIIRPPLFTGGGGGWGGCACLIFGSRPSPTRTS